MAFFVACAAITLVVGIIMTVPSRQSFSKTLCTAAITTDDLMNGNVTTEGTYFMGINQIATMVDRYRTNLTNINNNIT